MNDSVYYTDNTCTSYLNRTRGTIDEETRFHLTRTGVSSWWKWSGTTGTIQAGDVLYYLDGDSCITRTVADAPATDFLRGATWKNLVTADTPPTYVAPVVLEER
jgi:hypothetical protein